MIKHYEATIEGLKVKITYDFYKSTTGDNWTPSSGDIVEILRYELSEGEDSSRLRHNLDDDEWNDWLSDVEAYVYSDAVDDILEFENEKDSDY